MYPELRCGLRIPSHLGLNPICSHFSTVDYYATSFMPVFSHCSTKKVNYSATIVLHYASMLKKAFDTPTCSRPRLNT